MKNFIKKIPGILLCLCISVPSWAVVKCVKSLEVVGAPVIAIVCGMILAQIIKDKSPFSDGISFVSKKILQSAVVLLGFGLNLSVVGKVGLGSLPVILSTISISLIVSYLAYRFMKIPSKTAVLIGVGSSVCGGSAVAATAPVIDADDEEISGAISVIFLFNVAAALIFPSLGSFLGLSNESFGLFAGTAINDTSSVTAAASVWDSIHLTNGSVLEYATVVKLTRTLAIIPITLVLSLRKIRKNKAMGKEAGSAVKISSVFPKFILYFVAASLLTTVVTSFASGELLAAAEGVFGFFKQVSKFFIVTAMAAIGLNTDVVKLVKTGLKPILTGFLCWVSIIAISLLKILVF